MLSLHAPRILFVPDKNLGKYAESVLKNISNKLKKGDFLVIPGLASVPILNLRDRIKNVLNLDLSLFDKNNAKSNIVCITNNAHKNQRFVCGLK